MKNHFARFAALALWAAMISAANASHYMGAEMSYVRLSANTYRFYMRVLYDCAGGATNPLPGPAPSPALTFTSSLQGMAQPTPVQSNWVSVSYEEVTMLCPAMATRCQSSSASINGVAEALHYRDYVFPATNGIYTVAYTNCCRNSTITSGAHDEGIYVDVTINPSGPANSSPSFSQPPVAYIPIGATSTFSQAAIDPDGDSLVYSLVGCKQAVSQSQGITSVTYNPGFSPTAPLGPSWQCSLNSSTGELTFTPNPGNAVTAVLAVRVDEYRNGQILGHTVRDIQVTAVNIPSTGGVNTAVPVVGSIQNLTGALQLPGNVLKTVPNQTIAFDLTVTDADPNQIVWFPPVSGSQAYSITRTSIGYNPLTVHVTFPAGGQGSQALNIAFLDDFCPLPTKTYASYRVEVDNSLMITSVHVTPTPCGTTNGAIDLIVAGGVPPLLYAWSNGATTEDLAGLSPGNYTVTITDIQNHTVTGTYHVSGSDLQVAATYSWLNCLPNGGQISVSPIGGITPFSYQWGSGQTTATATGLAPDGYHLYITDATGCSNDTLILLERPASCEARITGSVFLDTNLDCVQDPLEPGLPFVYVNFTPGLATFTDADGRYRYAADTGAVELRIYPYVGQWIGPAACSSDTLMRHPVVYGTDSTGNDFARKFQGQSSAAHDLSVHVAASIPNPGYDRSVWLSVRNNSWQITAVDTLKWMHDSSFTYVSAIPAPTSYDSVTRTAVWINLDTLSLFQTHMVWITANTKVTTPVPSNTWDSVWVSASPADTFLVNNSLGYGDTTMSSFDPNDKQVSPAGRGPEGFISANDNVLTYTVRFQNTGTAPATYVVIRDTLDTDLDLSGLTLLGSSHPCVLNVGELNSVIFRFNNINLPNSGTNLAGSMGFVSFSVPLANTAQNTVIENRAGIWFDFNAPVITNMVQNFVCDSAKATFTATRQPGGIWTISSNIAFADYWLWNLGAAGVSYDLVPAAFSFPDSGTYTLQLIVNNLCTSDTATLVVYEPETNGTDAWQPTGISVQPNPVTGSARIRIADAQVSEVLVIDLAGRLVQALPVVQHEALFVRGNLAAGIYYLRATSASGKAMGLTLVVE